MEHQPLSFEELARKAQEIRLMALETIAHLGIGHVGGAMSIIEALVTLYYRHMKNIDPEHPWRDDRDRLILSKGHAGPALYAILADKGFFPREWLKTLNQGGTRLPSHCDRNLTPGIDMTTGSLGQGLSVAVGLALSTRLNKNPVHIYCILGDGECNEGQVWEAAMAAAHYRLNHLIAFVDYNKLQLDGPVHEIMNIEDITAKWVSFGWFVQRVDGHQFRAIDEAIVRAKMEPSRPSIIVLDTIKGKGVPFAEGIPTNHNMKFDLTQLEEIKKSLKA